MLKKLDTYILKRFATLLVMTFLICTLILVMQFLWKYFSDLVGKGVGVAVLLEFFVYAVAFVVPLALPLAILLASLMVFGNLGENFELTAMKSSGVSLFRIMLPLIFLITFVCGGAFYFSNNILPISQTKLWTLLVSIRAKSPEVDIPVGEFFTGIKGYHFFVNEKSGGYMHDMMIYDYSEGFNNATVMVADTGKIQITSDKKFLLLTLRSGESFENLKNQRSSGSMKNIPYRRETFGEKQILMTYDSDFNRYDESVMKNQHVSKNLTELTASIDSLNRMIDSTTTVQATDIVAHNYLGKERYYNAMLPKIEEKAVLKRYKSDSIFVKMNYTEQLQSAQQAVEICKQKNTMITGNKYMVESSLQQIVRHVIEMHKKFTLSFACLIFFFIGAPLGAIIRKGGLGMPVVVSVAMFIAYYIIDTTGIKMAREGLWESWQGMWLSSFVLLPIGIFLTYKAAKDSELFRSESYKKFFKNINHIYKLIYHFSYFKLKKMIENKP